MVVSYEILRLQALAQPVAIDELLRFIRRFKLLLRHLAGTLAAWR
jgi:hypothetical protein